MRNKTVQRFSYLLAVIAGFRQHLAGGPSPEAAKHEFHLSFGENPIFTPRRKHKGYMKQQGRKKGFNKFQKH